MMPSDIPHQFYIDAYNNEGLPYDFFDNITINCRTVKIPYLKVLGWGKGNWNGNAYSWERYVKHINERGEVVYDHRKINNITITGSEPYEDSYSFITNMGKNSTISGLYPASKSDTNKTFFPSEFVKFLDENNYMTEEKTKKKQEGEWIEYIREKLRESRIPIIKSHMTPLQTEYTVGFKLTEYKWKEVNQIMITFDLIEYKYKNQKNYWMMAQNGAVFKTSFPTIAFSMWSTSTILFILAVLPWVIRVFTDWFHGSYWISSILWSFTLFIAAGKFIAREENSQKNSLTISLQNKHPEIAKILGIQNINIETIENKNDKAKLEDEKKATKQKFIEAKSKFIEKYKNLGYIDMDSELGRLHIMGKENLRAKVYVNQDSNTIEEEEYTV